MPRDGAGVYSTPPGTHGTPNTTILSANYNSNVDDVAADLNTPRPVVAGGTGATTAAGALTALGAVAKAGDTMTGLLVLSADPSAALGAATKQYADLKVGRINVITWDSGGTYTPSAGLLYAIAEGVGAGGAGGGCPVSTGAFGSGGGGGAGSYSRRVLTAAMIGASQTVTIGAGGFGVSGATGNAGGSVSLGVLLVCNGGSGGGLGINGTGGAGGVAGSGDIMVVGAAGAAASAGSSTATNATCAIGATSPFGGPDAPTIVNNGVRNGASAVGYGGGGNGGAGHNAAAASAGGNGSQGFLIITEFCSQ